MCIRDSNINHYLCFINDSFCEYLCCNRISIFTNKMCIRDRCNVCQKTKECIQKDDMQEIYSKMLEAKIIVVASPVYFYTFNGYQVRNQSISVSGNRHTY